MYLRILILLFCINKIFSKTSCCKTCQVCRVSCIKKDNLDIDCKNIDCKDINNNTIGINNIVNLDILKANIEDLKKENEDLTNKINELKNKNNDLIIENIKTYQEILSFLKLKKDIEDKKKFLLDNNLAKEVKDDDIDISKFIKNNPKDFSEESFKNIKKRNEFYNDINLITKFNKLKKFANDEIEKCNKMIKIHNKKAEVILNSFIKLKNIEKTIKENEKTIEDYEKIIEGNEKIIQEKEKTIEENQPN